MTERLYDRDAYLRAFDAVVVSCEETEKGFAVELSQTAFFPEGGGQLSDRGFLSGSVVSDVRESHGRIFHYTDRAFLSGETVWGEIDWTRRFLHMQEHTAEHILSGLANTVFGCTNVGFHLGETEVTTDYDRPLGEAEMTELEDRANLAVFENRGVRCFYPSPQELKNMTYRSKISLTEGVRIVDIDGIDKCACCAPHVARTGEVGLIRVIAYERYKGGTRCFIRAGFDALSDYRDRCRQLSGISHMLSARPDVCDIAVARLMEEAGSLRAALSETRRKLLEERVDRAEAKEGRLLSFSDVFDTDQQRYFVNGCIDRAPRLCGCFSPRKEGGFSFVLGSKELDLRPLAAMLRQKLGAKCGGSTDMISGFAPVDESSLRLLLEQY